MQRAVRARSRRSPAAPSAQARAASAFLARLRAWIERADPGPEFRARARATLAERFGSDGSYGVFVRSDTNVEDLPGFTGAGLNLTVPNVVGTQQVLATRSAASGRRRSPSAPTAGARRTWSSRSTCSRRWSCSALSVREVGRDGHRRRRRGGEPGWITVAMNEGVGGAVDGQAAESLRVSHADGRGAPARAGDGAAAQRALAARRRRAGAGQRRRSVLAAGEIAQLVDARAASCRSASRRCATRTARPLPADVEFAFRGGRLTLLQIRPLVESRAAQRNAYLLSLDAAARERRSAGAARRAVRRRPRDEDVALALLVAARRRRAPRRRLSARRVRGDRDRAPRGLSPGAAGQGEGAARCRRARCSRAPRSGCASSIGPTSRSRPPTPRSRRKLRALLGGDAPRYGVALLDLSDPEHPRYAEHNADVGAEPGQRRQADGRARLVPGARRSPSRRSRSAAPRAARDPGRRRRLHPERPPHGALLAAGRRARGAAPDRRGRPRQPLDLPRLDVLEQLERRRQHGAEAPAPAARPGRALPGLGGRGGGVPGRDPEGRARQALRGCDPVAGARAGLDLERLRQGSFFSHVGKQRVPGTSSTATPRELLRYLVKLEQGQLVDAFSSLEIKKLLYLTDRSIRYASSPALADAAVYFKSGSLYSCQPEPGFACKKYHGNVRNYMNSTAIVEVGGRRPPLALHRGGALERAAAQLGRRAPDAGHPDPPPGGVAAPGRRSPAAPAHEARGKISRSSATMISPSQASPRAPLASATAM